MGSVELLKKVLELERTRGYGDVAVMGGLDSFLQRQATEIAATNSKLGELLAMSYSALSPAERRAWLAEVLDILDGRNGSLEPNPAPDTPQVGVAHSTEFLSAPVAAIKGIRSSTAAKLAKLGVKTVGDILYFFPHRHIDYSQRCSIAELKAGVEQTIIAEVREVSAKIIGKRIRSTEAIVGDSTGTIRIVWFNQPYLAKQLRPRTRVAISGKVSLFQGRRVFESPEYEILESDDLIHTGRLVPVYHLTEGLAARTVRRLVKETVDLWAHQVADFMPLEVLQHTGLPPLPQAIRQMHYPDNEPWKERARRRLAFDELFLLQLRVLSRKREWQEAQPGNPLTGDAVALETFISSLPFTFTPAQERVLKEIREDLAKPKPMSRLLQGDVGSGKTVVAAAALLIAASSGYQGALMAPTEILAEQHFNTLCSLLSRAGELVYLRESIRVCNSPLTRPVVVGVLTGSTPKSARQELQQRILSGELDIIIGTHTLIQEGIEFKRLGLAVIDEQHRFGVVQRAALRQKGFNPHLLVMTATPIPRTLALTVYGDLDLSVIDQLPPGRQQIKTRWVGPEKRERAYDFLRQQIKAARQAFIICPLIEESEAIEAKAAVTEYERLSREVFPDLRLGLLHGRMAASEKDSVMRRFRDGELDILVSTAVVEVGIDVPNASVMLVEGADRFGLSQLHQFRGRVGRGEHQSYCLLLSDSFSPEARERLGIMERTHDGFLLAEEDLRLRGPGEFFGTRQSGLPDLRMARLSDVTLLEMARREAIRLFQDDSDLAKHPLLVTELARVNPQGEGDLS